MTPEEEKKKRELFDNMSPRSQKRIMKKGYDKWDPFLAPKEPPYYSQEERERVQRSAQLLQQFLYEKGGEKPHEPLPAAYVQGVKEICFGLGKGDERFQGMYDFSRWLDRVQSESAKEE